MPDIPGTVIGASGERIGGICILGGIPGEGIGAAAVGSKEGSVDVQLNPRDADVV